MRDESEPNADPESSGPSSAAPNIDPAVLDLDHVFEVLDHPRRPGVLGGGVVR